MKNSFTKNLQLVAFFLLGIGICFLVACLSSYLSSLIPNGLISGGVFALLIGMLLNPLLVKLSQINPALKFMSKFMLKFAIVLMGFSLSFAQLFKVGGFSLIVMTFTLISAFGVGYLLGKLFKMDWKLSSLISAGTGICGGSAIAAIAPTINAKDSDVAYAISSTFLFDVVMVVLFPIMGKAFGMSDIGYGLWAGTAVNDTSSVVAAGYAFSDAAGNFAVIVKLTRTLSIIPVVLIFSFINARVEKKKILASCDTQSMEYVKPKVNWLKIFPIFILFFIACIGIKSSGIVPENIVGGITKSSKFIFVMSLAAIGAKTNIREFKSSGFKPMLHGFLISLLVVVVSFAVQYMLGQI